MTDAQTRAWERLTELPLTAAALAYLAAFAIPILAPDAPAAVVTLCQTTSFIAWALFVADYLVRLSLSTARWRFVRTNLLDAAVILLPMLRPLRMLRLVPLLSVFNRTAGSSLRGKVAVYVSGAGLLTLFVAALSILDVERSAPNATIRTFADAAWWALTTVTTVGYGDSYPVTSEGRVIAATLMLAGIALIGVVSATFASWLIDRVRALEEDAQMVTRRDLEAIRHELSEVKALLAAQVAASSVSGHQALGTGAAASGPPPST